jgi:nicotinate-nucleotide adenylyltransferase
MTVISLFGGSFNPPTLAHRKVVEALQAALPSVPVALLPAPLVAHKDPASLVAFDHRMNMARLLAGDLGDVKVSDFSLQVSSAQTVDVLRAWRATYPGHHVIWVMGADSFASLPQWDEWEDIVQTTSLYVVARRDHVQAVHDTLPAQLFAAHELAEPQALAQQVGWYVNSEFDVPVSATAARAALALGEASPFILPNVAEYIARYGLYR